MTTEAPDRSGERLAAHGAELEVVRRGSGPPILLLHGFQNVPADAPVIAALARGAEVVAPSHPGFGGSPRPDGFESMYDVVHIYLDVIDRLGHERLTVMGLSFGGWIAAELAVLRPRQVSRLVLVDSLGIRLSAPDKPDILDVFNTHPREVRRAAWHDPERFAPDHDAMSDAQLMTIARNWDALCLYGWSPYMHNPRLKRWLGRIDMPTLVLWGSSDRIVTPDYGRAYAGCIPGARFALIEKAGHHPEIEQPEALAALVIDFLTRTR